MVRVKDIRKELILMVAILLPLCLGISSCISREQRQLDAVELMLESNPAKADTMLSSMSLPSGKHQRAWYAVLRTQADYKNYKPIVSDSLILTATEWFGSPYNASNKKRYRAAMAWYSQGCIYSELNKDLNAIEAFLKAKDLFPDTLVRYYALTEQNTGKLFLNRQMIEQSTRFFKNCISNANRLSDTITSHYATYNLGLCYLYSGDYTNAESIYDMIINEQSYSHSQKNMSLLQLAKIYFYYYKDHIKALEFLNTYLRQKNNPSISGAGYALKGNIFYSLGRIDSASYYYTLSFENTDNLYTTSSDAARLTELSIINGLENEALEWFNVYSLTRDTIGDIEKTNEIIELQFKHEADLKAKDFKAKHLFILFVVSISVIMAFFLSLLYFSIKKKHNLEAIKKKMERLIEKQEEIRQSSIDMLAVKVRELPHKYNSKSRQAILNLYSKRISICRELFEMTEEHKSLVKIKTHSCNITHEKMVSIIEKLKDSFKDTIEDINTEVHNITFDETITLILMSMNCDNDTIARLCFVTKDAIRKRKQRIKIKAQEDFLLLFEQV